MIRFPLFVFSLCLVLVCTAGYVWAEPAQAAPSQTNLWSTATTVVLPSGTKVELALTVPVWAKTAKHGDPIYAQTNFPVAANGSIAIPPGTWVEGTIESITRPTRKVSRAELLIVFNKIIYADGYTIALTDSTAEAMAGGNQLPAGAQSGDPTVTAANVTVKVSTANDLLLDNGSQIEMTLAVPLALDARGVANAIPLSRAPKAGTFKSATLCHPTYGTPGTPGTSDTVIPGSPGTPSITIPGGPDMPDTTIPGTPATPDTVIPGTPGDAGTPGTYCPAPPMVVSSVPVDMKQVQTQNPAPSQTH